MSIGDKIKTLQKTRRWTLDHLSNLLNISQAILSEYERGLKEPRAANRKKLCAIFGIEEWELFAPPDKILAAKDFNAIPHQKRPIPVFNASCGKFIDFSDGSFPAGQSGEYEFTSSKDRNAFFVRAHGDSMTGRIDDKHTILEGDLLLVEPNQELTVGCLVFCRHDGFGVTVKKYKKYDHAVHLIPLNDKYPTIILKPGEQFQCFRVTEIKRKV